MKRANFSVFQATESELTPLHMAAFSGSEAVVRALLNSQGVQVEGGCVPSVIKITCSSIKRSILFPSTFYFFFQKSAVTQQILLEIIYQKKMNQDFDWFLLKNSSQYFAVEMAKFEWITRKKIVSLQLNDSLYFLQVVPKIYALFWNSLQQNRPTLFLFHFLKWTKKIPVSSLDEK